jgi:TetR/AcrR family transcriptional regulator
MTIKDFNTEERIVQAAEKVFIEKGMAGARMQQIADEAGINKALLHYYYRSKEKLFSIIFRSAVKAMVPNLIKSYQRGKGHFNDKIRKFVEAYLNIIEKNPHIPGFVIHELNNRPEDLIKMLSELNLDISFIISDIEAEIEKGNIKPIEPIHLLVNIVSLCIFPIVARPMITGIFFKGDKKDYKDFIKSRKDHVADFIIESIKAT